jgi:iron complex outermembrane receptor protein
MNMKTSERAALASALGLGLCGAVGQAAEEAPAAEVEVLEEVQITGTRILRQDYISPNPVQTIDAEQMERLGIVNIADVLTQIPSNVSSFQPRNQGGNPFFVGSTLANLRGLNPYFGTRTLTLVDSHRFVPTNQGQGVDLSVVPGLLVSRVEVVTGGASAAYGSDAVSGVVNILLDRNLTGLKAEADYGVTQRGDGGNYHLGVAGGSALFDDRAHVVFGAEYQKSNSIDDCSAARKWCARTDGLLVNGGTGFDTVGQPYTNPLEPTQPYRFRASNLRVNQVNEYGVIFRGVPGSTTTISTDAAGTGTSIFNIGQYGTRSPTQTVIGGDGVSTNAITSLYPDVERTTLYGRFSFDLTDSTQLFAETSFGGVQSLVAQGGPGFSLISRCVSADNAYLGGAFGTAVLAAAGNDNRPFGACAPNQTLVRKDWYSQIDRDVATDTKVYRVVLGLEGKFSDNWNWDTYYQYGRTKRTQVLHDNNTAKRMDMALDAVIDNRAGSATFGEPVCRVTRDGVAGTPRFPGDPNPPIDPARVALAEGCVPLSLFGNAPLTQAQHDYSFGDLFEQNEITQHVVALNTSGQLWKGWGYGPLSAAAGVEFRQEKLTNEAADLPFYQRTDFAAQYGDPFAGTTQVKEGYVELEMPLLSDLPFVKDLRLNVAARRTSYNTEDDLVTTNPDTKVSVTTWKFGAVWDATDWLRFRGSRSRDLRAAGFRELYYSQSIPSDPPGTSFGFGGVNNPWLPPGPFGGPQYDPSVVILSGNSALKPERAYTTTLGFVLSPQGFAEGMHFSADWYRIRLKEGISGGLIQRTIDRCYAGDQFYCSLIQGTAGGTPNPATGLAGFSDITELRAPYENGRPYTAEGVDITWDHNLPLNTVFSEAQGSFTMRASVTRAIRTQLEYLQYPVYVSRNVVGQVGAAGFLADYAPSPKWSGNFIFSYLTGPTTVTLQSQWTGKGRLNNEAPWTDPSQPGYNRALAGSVDDNSVGNYFVWNLIGSYDFRETTVVSSSQIYLVVNNLFDRTPPFSNGGIGGVNGTFYDTLGRSFRLGFRIKL